MTPCGRSPYFCCLLGLIVMGTTGYAPRVEAEKPTPENNKSQPVSVAKVEGDIQKQVSASNVITTIDPNRREYGILPALTFDSDIGFGLGAVGNITQFSTRSQPYEWQLQFLFYLTLKEAPDGSVEAPFHDYYLILDVPQAWDEMLRLRTKVGFGRYLTAGYYGIGNAARFDEALLEANKRYYQYDKISPYANISARFTMVKTEAWKLDLFVEPMLTYNHLNIYEGSRLEEDLESVHGELTRDFLYGTEAHLAMSANVGVLWDSRNHEGVPSDGLLSQASIRGGGGFGDEFGYFGLNVEQRAFYAIWDEYLVLAGRVLVDMLFGQVPIYELPRVGGFQPDTATGGEKSLRGIPSQRFCGKIKLLSNIELRSKILPFTVFDQRFNLGALVYLDSGRVFSDHQARRELDGSNAGIKLGTGFGLRLQWGEFFIIRSDFGYSPTEGTFAQYISIDHVF